MTYEVSLTHNAQKFYQDADDPLVRRLNRCFDQLQRDPYLDIVKFAIVDPTGVSLRAKRSNLRRSTCQPLWRLLRRSAPRNDNGWNLNVKL